MLQAEKKQRVVKRSNPKNLSSMQTKGRALRPTLCLFLIRVGNDKTYLLATALESS